MPIFTPVYRPTKFKQSFLARQQRQESRKRKREADSSGDDEDGEIQVSAESDPARTVPTTASHPVNKKDPYFIAGHSREEPLPLPPFPHAAVKESGKAKVPIDEELAVLSPPLYVPPAQTEDKSTSLKRRHLDNLTTILHRCMLKGDWPRASRAWSLLLRTEVAGRGIDVRRNGRWGIGAEILMRGGAKLGQDAANTTLEDIQASSNERTEMLPQFSDEGFRLAREYYERLILQYPHTPYTQHFLNATAIYPALFNIWIYEVQDRSKQARIQVKSSESDAFDNTSDSIRSDGIQSDERRQILEFRARELEEALPIATRMDELLSSPPYDTSMSLLQLRGMVALWISDLHSELSSSVGDSDISSLSGAETSDNRHHTQSRTSRQKARDIFERLKASDLKLPQEALNFLAEDND